MSDDPSRSPALYLVLGFMAGVLATVSVYVGYEVLLKPAPPRPTPTATAAPPSTTLALAPSPSPTPEAAPAAATPAPSPQAAANTKVAAATVPVAPPPKPPAAKGPAPGAKGPAPGARPSAAPVTGPQLAALLTQAEAASTAGNFDQAVQRYDEALKLDPGNAKAKEGRASAAGAVDALRRSFSFELTTAENVKGSPKSLDGFESDGVEVKRAPQVLGRIEFEVTPVHVKPGDTYSVKVFLVNAGKKDIKIDAMNLTRSLNGARTRSIDTPRTPQVVPKQRALVDVLGGVWAEETTSWSIEVIVKSNRGDTYQNQVVWK
jgi:hypothetical protein